LQPSLQNGVFNFNSLAFSDPKNLMNVTPSFQGHVQGPHAVVCGLSLLLVRQYEAVPDTESSQAIFGV
jgi:hypothetical protein